MILYHIVILALVQGITEFLPISSSGHLLLTHEILERGTGSHPADDLMMDIAVHIGTLMAVLIYFWRDVLAMLTGLKDLATGNHKTEGARLDLNVIVSTLPVIGVGFFLHSYDPSFVRSMEIMAWMTLIFGVVLWHADRFPVRQKSLNELTLKDAFLIGITQCLALVPGVSRSGITMTAARYLGFSRERAAHYSLLLAMASISGAGVLGVLDIIESGNAALGLDAIIAALLAFVSALIVIVVMMRWLRHSSFTPFAVYRVILGVALLGLIYTGVL
ncbi:MAG TPA: undecaprenyl-diphosphatase [Rhodospirillaceae bacterium]|nr:undecaprenyl-diphosphatase [Rhodospirillaceae bacterium]